MTSPDPAMDMPVRNWGQQGSFITKIFPPSDGPMGGTLIQLPCINQDWLLPLMGAIDQLRNPSVWNVLTDLDMDGVLGWVTQLQEMMWSGMDVPCCNVTMRLTSDCVLQFSTDGGSIWSDVTDWSTNLSGCIQVNLPGPVPPNPGGLPNDQHACNISGYMAQEIIQQAIKIAVTAYNDTLDLIGFGTSVMNSIGWAFPITALAWDAFAAVYSYFTSLTIAEFTTASTDPILWSDVTCAIYNAIKAAGYVTDANLPTLISNVCAISYVPTVVVSALCDFVTKAGLGNIRAWQDAGAYDDVDCSGCGEWCYLWDLRLASAPWVPQYGSGTDGHYVASTGFVGDVDTGGGFTKMECDIIYTFTGATSVSKIEMEIFSSAADTHTNCHIQYHSAGTWYTDAFSIPASPSGIVHLTFVAHNPVDAVALRASQDGSSAGWPVITKVKMLGNGSNPFGVTNCT
jgi:hypothetical protein